MKLDLAYLDPEPLPEESEQNIDNPNWKNCVDFDKVQMVMRNHNSIKLEDEENYDIEQDERMKYIRT